MLDRTAGSEGRGEGWSWKQEAHWAVAMGLSHPGGAWSRVGLEPRSLLGLAMGLSCRRGREEGSRVRSGGRIVRMAQLGWLSWKGLELLTCWVGLGGDRQRLGSCPEVVFYRASVDQACADHLMKLNCFILNPAS